MIVNDSVSYTYNVIYPMILPRNPHRNEKPITRYPIFSPKIPGFFLGLDPWLVAGDDIDDSFDGTIVDVYCISKKMCGFC